MIFSTSAISTIVRKASFTTAGIASIVALSAVGASAATINNELVGSDGFLIEGSFSASDILNLTVSGEVDNFPAAGPDGFTTNAAGILTVDSNPTERVVGQIFRPFGNFNSGALLIVTFQDEGQIFASNSANGFESTNPPKTLFTGPVTLGSILGPGFRTAEQLFFAIQPYSNVGPNIPTQSKNSIATVGSFASNPNAYTLSGSITPAAPTTAVPEPFTIIGTLIGGTAALRMRNKLKSTSV